MHPADTQQVLYDDDQPANTVGEINGQSADINKGYGGKCVFILLLTVMTLLTPVLRYVWLRVHRANSPSATVNNIWVHIGDDDNSGSQDLAMGAGGDYRFLKWSNDDGDRT